MQELIETVAGCSSLLVPFAAMWAVACLYCLQTGGRCIIKECSFLLVLVLIAGITVRSVVAMDASFLLNTATLGVVVVAGVIRKPAPVMEIEEAI